MEWNEGRRFVVGHLPVRLHEHERAIGGGLVLAALTNVPPFLLVIRYVAMVCRHSLQLDLNFTLQGPSNGEEVLLVGFKDDLLLDQVLVFVAADPGGSSAQSRRILLIVIDLFDGVVAGPRTHNLEGGIRLVRGFTLVRHLVKVIVHNLAQIDQRILLDLDGNV